MAGSEAQAYVEVLQAGAHTTLQDAGRQGYRKYGVPQSGAMDPYAYTAANLLVGNSVRETAIEMTLTGPTLCFRRAARFAVCGGRFDLRLNGASIPRWRTIFAPPMSVLEVGRSASGCRAYLAVAGGFAVSPVLGSASTYTRAAMGGWMGRALQAGDLLPLKLHDSVRQAPPRQHEPVVSRWGIAEPTWYGTIPSRTLRATKGGHYDRLTTDSQLHLTADTFRVSPQSDRMGYRVEGPRLTFQSSLDLVSEGVMPGTVQLPSGGLPIILGPDSQTTGGYPRVLHVTTVDFPVLAQLRPGDRFQFSLVDATEANRLLRARARELRQLEITIALRNHERG